MHTKEPWILDGLSIKDAAGNGLVDPAVKAEIVHANKARAVACVNACAGMSDPAADIAAMRDALEEAINWAEGYTLGRLMDMPEFVATAKRALGQESS